ncbi:MAG: TonB family protein [Fibromonadales bacterium]|nr:TonB family protein [Fibromonadales bacterium]
MYFAPLFVLLFLALASHAQVQERVAILNTVDDSKPELDPTELNYLTVSLREIAEKMLPQKRYFVMTSQSIIEMLGPERKEECKNKCMLDMGKLISADYIGQARLGRLGGNLSITMELYHTKGNLIGSFTGNAKEVLGLVAVINEKAPSMFGKMPDALVGSKAPSVAGGIGGVQVKGTDYEFAGEKRYLANISSDPEGASLSFNGVPDTRCKTTPCSVELGEGSVRIIAALEQYEMADTTVSIKQNNQSIRIRMKANFGVLEIKPAYSDGIGKDERWSLIINGKAVSAWENRLSPNKYKVELSHRCYEDLSFDVGINRDKREVFDMASYVKLKKGGLVLNAERDGKPVSEVVFVNGVQVGETPFSGSVAVCARVEIGKNREAVDVKLKYNEKVNYTYKVDLGGRRGSATGGFNDGYAEIGDALGGLMGGSAGGLGTKAKGSLKAPSARDIDMGSGDGSRSKAEIMAVVNVLMPGLRNIYNKYLKLKPGFSGKVTLKFTIAPSGDIVSINIVSSTTHYDEFDEAVKNMVATWKWKAIKSGNTTPTIPFNFTE